MNNVAWWPDLTAGLREMQRVTGPDGGRILVAWHGGHDDSALARRFALPQAAFTRIEQEITRLFTGTQRHELEFLTAFTASR